MKPIAAYLKDMLERIERIERYTQAGRQSFFDSTETQDAVIRNFEVIGEIVKRLPSDLTAAYPEIPWRQIAGFRDVLIHDYDDVDIESVWNTRQTYLEPLKQTVRSMLDSLDDS